MKIGVNDGHTLRGAGTGAVGIIKEGEHTRLVGEEVRRLLKERGNTVYNCIVDYAATTSESLSLVVQQANREDLDWFIAIHFNAGGGQGVEVYTYEGRQYQDAIDVCNNIAALGFNNRGVKAGTGLYVIRKTKAKSMLIEVCFVDTEDANKYLQVGYKAIAKAIVDALDKHIVEVKPSWKKNDTGWWYDLGNGSYPTNKWMLINGEWYYFDNKGYAYENKWLKYKDKWYWFNADCKMVKECILSINGKYYAFNKEGIMLENTTVNVKENGELVL